MAKLYIRNTYIQILPSMVYSYLLNQNVLFFFLILLPYIYNKDINVHLRYCSFYILLLHDVLHIFVLLLFYIFFLSIDLSRRSDSNRQHNHYKWFATTNCATSAKCWTFNRHDWYSARREGFQSTCILLCYLMYSHHPIVATPISPLEFLCPSWVIKRKANN